MTPGDCFQNSHLQSQFIKSASQYYGQSSNNKKELQQHYEFTYLFQELLDFDMINQTVGKNIKASFGTMIFHSKYNFFSLKRTFSLWYKMTIFAMISNILMGKECRKNLCLNDTFVNSFQKKCLNNKQKRKTLLSQLANHVTT